MAIKLKLVFQSPLLRSALKAAIFGLLLALAAAGDYRLTPVLIFAAVSMAMFFRPLFQTASFLWSFFVFLPAALIFMWRLPGVYFWIGLILCSLLFYILLGIKSLTLVNREQAQLFFVFGTLLLVFLPFFSGNFNEWLYLKIFAIFVASGFLLKTILNKNAVAWMMGFFTAQASLAIALLPLGFIQATTMLLAVIFIAQEVFKKQSQGILNRQAIISAVILLAIVVLIVFSASRWTF